jgi:hypothetical protein
MEKELIITLTVIYFKESGKMIKEAEKEFFIGLMEVHIKEGWIYGIFLYFLAINLV